jgi:hypothetical protein
MGNNQFHNSVEFKTGRSPDANKSAPAGKPAPADRPDYYRILSDMSRKNRQLAVARASSPWEYKSEVEGMAVAGASPDKSGWKTRPGWPCHRERQEDSSGRAGNIKEPEMTPDGFYGRLCSVLPPKSQSDRTTFRRIASWTIRKCKYDGHNEYELCARILDFAREANNPLSKNPAAVFISNLKKELGYPK